MEKIVVGFLGCGNIGCGVYKLLETYGAQMEKNEGVAFEVRRILVRSLNKSRAWAIPSTLLTDCPEDVLDNPEIDMVMEFMGGEQPAASYMVRALENGFYEPLPPVFPTQETALSVLPPAQSSAWLRDTLALGLSIAPIQAYIRERVAPFLLSTRTAPAQARALFEHLLQRQEADYASRADADVYARMRCVA